MSEGSPRTRDPLPARPADALLGPDWYSRATSFCRWLMGLKLGREGLSVLVLSKSTGSAHCHFCGTAPLEEILKDLISKSRTRLLTHTYTLASPCKTHVVATIAPSCLASLLIQPLFDSDKAGEPPLANSPVCVSPSPSPSVSLSTFHRLCSSIPDLGGGGHKGIGGAKSSFVVTPLYPCSSLLPLRLLQLKDSRLPSPPVPSSGAADGEAIHTSSILPRDRCGARPNPPYPCRALRGASLQHYLWVS